MLGRLQDWNFNMQNSFDKDKESFLDDGSLIAISEEALKSRDADKLKEVIIGE
jgi:hypothetical protein